MAMIKPITWQLFGHIREGVTFPKITGPPDAFRARYLLRKKHTMSTIIVIKNIDVIHGRDRESISRHIINCESNLIGIRRSWHDFH